MKLSPILPISAIVAGCSSIAPPPSSEPSSAPSNTSSSQTVVPATVTKTIEVCEIGVDTILEFPYGDGVFLEMKVPDRCADQIAYFMYKNKIERRGRLILAKSKKTVPWILQNELEVLVYLWPDGMQRVLVWGKPLTGKQEQLFILRVDNIEKNGFDEKSKKLR